MYYLLISQRLKNVSLRFLLCVFLITCMACSKEEDTGQLITDPSLNLADGKIFPDSWYYWQLQSKHKFFWAAKEPNSKDFYLAISTDSLDSVNISYFNQGILTPIPKGKPLTLRARVKADNLNGMGASLVIRCDGPNRMAALATTDGKTSINGTFDWKEFTLVLDNVPDETNAIQVFLVYLPSTTGKVYFDDITLTYDK